MIGMLFKIILIEIKCIQVRLIKLILNVNAHLTKPYTTEKLLKTVAAVLMQNQARAANN
jgi:hypothetical protein